MAKLINSKLPKLFGNAKSLVYWSENVRVLSESGQVFIVVVSKIRVLTLISSSLWLVAWPGAADPETCLLKSSSTRTADGKCFSCKMKNKCSNWILSKINRRGRTRPRENQLARGAKTRKGVLLCSRRRAHQNTHIWAIDDSVPIKNIGIIDAHAVIN